MSSNHNIVIAGAGGQAVALILAEFSDTPPQLFIGNRIRARRGLLARP